MPSPCASMFRELALMRPSVTLLVEAVSPVALEVALTVQQELQSRLEEADRLRLQQVERAQYEADLARRRYMRVDPDEPAGRGLAGS